MKGLTNRELINTLIEHYAVCGEVEVKLYFALGKTTTVKHYVIAYLTEEYSLQLKAPVE